MHYLEATHCEEGEAEVQRMRIQHPKIHQTSESCQVERRSLGLTGVSVEGSASPDVNCGETTRHARPPQLLPDLSAGSWPPITVGSRGRCPGWSAVSSPAPGTLGKWIAILWSAAQSCLSLWDPMDCSPPASSVHGDSPGKNTGGGRHALLQGIFSTQGSNSRLPHCRRTLHPRSHKGSPGTWIISSEFSKIHIAVRALLWMALYSGKLHSV